MGSHRTVGTKMGERSLEDEIDHPRNNVAKSATNEKVSI